MTTTIDSSQVVPWAGVLVGGQSRRMGRAKALLPHPSGRTFVEHAVRIAQSLAKEVLILGSVEELPRNLIGFRVLEDRIPEAGPLVGLSSLLTCAGDQWSFLLACDMPFVGVEPVRRLASFVATDVNAIAFQRTGSRIGCHATCAFYHPRLLPEVEAELEHGRRSIQSVLSGARTKRIVPTHDEIRQLTNVNTPEDYAELA